MAFIVSSSIEQSLQKGKAVEPFYTQNRLFNVAKKTHPSLW